MCVPFLEISLDHYNTLVTSMSSRVRLGSNPSSITYWLLTLGKWISLHAPHPQTQKRDHNNNDLIRELYELTNTTLKTRRTGSGVLSRHYLLLLAHISNRAHISFLLICRSSSCTGPTIFLQYNLPNILRQLVQMLGATLQKIFGKHILETIAEEWNQYFWQGLSLLLSIESK